MVTFQPLTVPFTSTLRDRIDVPAWIATAFRSVRPMETFRTPSPSSVHFLLSFAITVTLPTAIGFALKRFVPNASDGLLKGYAIGMVAGCLAVALYLVVQTLFQNLPRAARARGVEALLLQMNGGVHGEDKPGTATFDTAGLRFEGKDYALSFAWSQLSAFVDRQDHYLFILRDGFAMPLPKAPMSDDERHRLRLYIERWAPGTGPMPTPPREIGAA